jgi:hypothetical protein
MHYRDASVILCLLQSLADAFALAVNADRVLTRAESMLCYLLGARLAKEAKIVMA